LADCAGNTTAAGKLVLAARCLPATASGPGRGPEPPSRSAGGACDMVPRRICRHPLAATAGLVWNADLPRPLQQVLFDSANAISPDPAR